MNSKLFGRWDFHLTENSHACPYMWGETWLMANYNFCSDWRTTHWHATWGGILINSFRISAVSVDNEVILLRERWHCMKRLCGPYPLWNTLSGHDLTRTREPVGTRYETNESWCERRHIFNNGTDRTKRYDCKLSAMFITGVSKVRRRNNKFTGTQLCCSISTGSSHD